MTKSTQTPNGQYKPVILRDPVSGRILGITKRPEAEFRESFFKRVKVGSASECWEWQGAKSMKAAGRNYGVIWFNGKKFKTHRVAWMFAYGPIPTGMLVCHTCDNPPCCNPNHLFIGTDKDNRLDCLKKGRGNNERGERRYNAVLTPEKVKAIRARYNPRSKGNSGAALAKEFGVGNTMISSIIHRLRWRHIQ